MAWGDGRIYRGAWVQSKCTGFGVLTHADGRRYEGYYLKDKMHGHGVYMWADGRKYNGEYKNNLKHGQGVWTWPDGVMLEGQWADNLPCRHAVTIIFSSYVSTQEVQPRIGLDSDTTLQKLHEDAHAWRIEHGVVHKSSSAEDNSSAVPRPVILPPSPADDEIAPAGAAATPTNGSGTVAQANTPGVDAGGRPAGQTPEMYESLRAIAMQLEQGLVDLEETQGLVDDEEGDTVSLASFRFFILHLFC